MASSTEYLTLLDFERRAMDIIPPGSLAYIKSGADEEWNVNESRKAWKRYFLRPRVLRGVELRDLHTTLLGHRVSMPVGIAPTGYHQLVNSEAECATVRAAVDKGVVMTLSTAANKSPEEVWIQAQSTNSDCLLWYQLYILADRQKTGEIVRRVEKIGYRAIVVTVDVPVAGNRIEPFRHPHKFVAGFEVPAIMNKGDLATVKSTHELNQAIFNAYDKNLTWEDVKWLTKLTKLPVIAKGILTADDAEKAVEVGCKGVWVSSHGGRQLDSVAAPVDVLPEIYHRVKERVEIYLDGGVRHGSDVIKGLLLGAKCVFVGRAILYALACQGEDGVKRALDIIRKELDTDMAGLGIKNISELSPKNSNLIYSQNLVSSKL